MKIAYCIQSLRVKGGIERILSIKANWLVNNGYEVAIITTDQGSAKPSFDLDSRIKLYDLDLRYQEDNSLNTWQRLKELYRKQAIHKEGLEEVVEQFQPDIMISTSFQETPILPKLKDKSKKVLEQHSSKFTKVLMHPKTSYFKRALGYLKVKYQERITRAYDKFVILTNEEFPLWENNDNVVVIPNSNPLSPDLISSLTEKKVLAVGRFEYQKNFKELIDIWAIVHRVEPSWSLDIVGGGHLQTSVKTYAKNLDLDESVNFVGTSNHVEDYYLNSSIYALSSHYEGLPMVLLEAQATGLPIVSYACPSGPRDIVTDGKDGFLVPQYDKDTFAQRLLELMKNENLRKQMGTNAKETSKRFSVEVIMRQWESLFSNLIHK